ncbi:MAG: HAD-IA family hydrolase [Candidatus Woesearchaeota archaeon]|nr:HAD-IA family hydrolase [Candidatus Woesearchaeota archaeon]
MDGVIIDSNHIHYDTWSYVFKQYGYIIDKKEFGMHLGESAFHFTEHFVKAAKLDVKIQVVLDKILERSREERDRVLLKPHVSVVLPILKRDYKIALATGANREWAEYVVKKFGLSFDFIIGGDEVRRAKPDPEIFLRAAKGLGLDPKECVVVEDALLGMRAAKAAGIKVIAIPDEFTRYQDHSISDLKIVDVSGLISILKQIDKTSG